MKEEPPLRKRLATLVMAVITTAILIPAGPASASSCDIGDPGLEDVQCLVFNEPAVRALCAKLPAC